MIPLSRPAYDAEEVKAASEVLLSGQLVQGPKVAAFEAALSARLGGAEVIAVSNGTVALHLALMGLGIGAGDEVIVPAFSHPATANSVVLAGGRPVFCDIDLASLNLDPALLEPLVTTRTKAIMPVHEFGFPADMDAIMAFANKHSLMVVEDAACALGSAWKGKPCGTFGAAATFSFHPRKIITTGEGGIISTFDRKLAERLRLLRAHGMRKDANGGHDYPIVGMNARLTDFQAAIGLAQMAKLDAILAHRQEAAAIYDQLLTGAELTMPTRPAGGAHSLQTYHVLLPAGINRDALIPALAAEGIGVNFGADAMPTLQALKPFANGRKYPNAEAAYRRGLALPLYFGLAKNDQRKVAETLLRQLSLHKSAA